MMEPIIKWIKRNRIVFVFLAIVLVPILSLSYYLVYENYRYRHEEEIRKNLQMAQVLGQNIDGFLGHVKATLTSMGSLTTMESGNRPSINEQFRVVNKEHPELSLLWLLDSKGKIIAKYPEVGPDKTGTGKAFFEEPMKGKVYVSDRFKGEMTGKDLVVVAVPHRNKQGKIIGVIGTSILVKSLQNKTNLKVGSTGYTVLVNESSRRFLAHPKLEEVSNKVQPNDIIWQRITSTEAGSFDEVTPFDNKRKVFTYVHLKEAPWIVIIVQPLSEIEAQLKPLITKNGLIIFLVCLLVVLAIGYVIQTRNRIEEARVQRAEKLALVGELAAGMAHEIKNPLTSIRGFIQLISMYKDKTVPEEYLNTILMEIDRIQEIVNETLVLAKPTPKQFVAVDLKKLLEELCFLMNPQARMHNINIEFNTAVEELVIMAEPSHLKQVIVNLIKNAIEAIGINGGNVNLSLAKSDGNAKIIVEDTGDGIPASILKKIGTPFLTTKEKGTGLGLTVTYRIIQNHGGKVNVVSSKNGTKFEIILPINK